MRKWGVLVTVFYTVVLLFVLDRIVVSMFDGSIRPWGSLPWWIGEKAWPIAVWAALLVAGQALMFFVSVDTSFRRIQPRRHIGVAVATVALMIALLSTMTAWSVVVAIGGDDTLPDNDKAWTTGFISAIAIFWIAWGFIFHRYKAGDSTNLNRMVGWLIKGSILELLIVVPCHVIVRQREDCSAPGVTAYGIATGIAVMLLTLGPSVLFLYQKRLGEYRSGRPSGED